MRERKAVSPMRGKRRFIQESGNYLYNIERKENPIQVALLEGARKDLASERVTLYTKKIHHYDEKKVERGGWCRMCMKEQGKKSV